MSKTSSSLGSKESSVKNLLESCLSNFIKAMESAKAVVSWPTSEATVFLPNLSFQCDLDFPIVSESEFLTLFKGL